MPSTVEELSKNRVKLTIEVQFAEIKPSLDKAYKAISQQISIPGFRKGHVPAALIDQRIGAESVMQEALNEVLPTAYNSALAEHGIIPLGDPTIEVTQMEKGKDIVFTAEVDKRPEFTLPTFSDIKVDVANAPSGEEQVEERLGILRARFATQAEVERAAADGDIVVVNLKGSKEGEALPEAEAEGISFKLGGTEMMDGLNEAVRGLKVGESQTFTSTLVGGPLKGTEADIEVEVVKVFEQTLPELDDEFAQMVSEFDTLEEMKADLAQAGTQMNLFEQAAEARDKALEAIVDKTEIELPESLVENEIANRKASVEQQLAQAGTTLEDYLTDVEDGRSAEDFWAEIEKNTVTAIKARLVLDKLAEESDVQVDQADLTNHLIRRAQQSGTSPEQEMQHMMDHNHVGEWVAEIRRTKALDSIMSHVQVVDADGKAVDLSILAPKVAERQVVVDEDSLEAPAEATKPAKKGTKESADSADSPSSADSAT